MSTLEGSNPSIPVLKDGCGETRYTLYLEVIIY
jgi:hypothetical protein